MEVKESYAQLLLFAHCSLCKAWEASCFPCSEAVDRRFWPTTLAWSLTALIVVVREVPMLWKAFCKSSKKLTWLPAAMQRSSKTTTLILPFCKITNSFSFLFLQDMSKLDRLKLVLSRGIHHLTCLMNFTYILYFSSTTCNSTLFFSGCFMFC